MKKWQCSVCKYIHEGDEPPEKCPVCGVPASKFVLIEDDSPEKETPKATDQPPKESARPEAPAVPATGFEKVLQLLVQHHAHPVSVHMPNGLLPVSAVLFVLAWLFDADLLAKAAFINLIFVVLALPLVLFSGVVEWKKKYAQAQTTIFKVKILAATVTCAGSIISLIWFLIDPKVTASSTAWVFVLLNLVMLGAAGIAGHIGGKLVFKD